MKTLFTFIKLVMLTTVFSACSSFQAREYKSDYKSVEMLKERSEKNHIGYVVKPFTSSMKNPNKLLCRGMADFTAPYGKAFPKYIEDALVDELTLAKVLNAGGVEIGAHFDDIDFSSFGGGWTIKGSLTVGKKSFPVDFKYGFPAGWADGNSCINAENSFPDAVNAFLKVVYEKIFNLQK